MVIFTVNQFPLQMLGHQQLVMFIIYHLQVRGYQPTPILQHNQEI